MWYGPHSHLSALSGWEGGRRTHTGFICPLTPSKINKHSPWMFWCFCYLHAFCLKTEQNQNSNPWWHLCCCPFVSQAALWFYLRLISHGPNVFLLWGILLKERKWIQLKFPWLQQITTKWKGVPSVCKEFGSFVQCALCDLQLPVSCRSDRSPRLARLMLSAMGHCRLKQPALPLCAAW